jgi:large subunit ribosomal protein L5
MAKMISLKEWYTKGVVENRSEFGVDNVFAVPRIEKVTVNVGVGKFHKESQKIDAIVADIAAITGQKPVVVMSKKAIAGFKIRQGAPSGVKVTIRGGRMWDFLDRLVHIALPRTRDFHGLEPSVIDKEGNINIGIREHMIFPEIKPEKVQFPFSLQVTVVTTAKDQESAQKLFHILKFPIKKPE